MTRPYSSQGPRQVQTYTGRALDAGYSARTSPAASSQAEAGTGDNCNDRMPQRSWWMGYRHVTDAIKSSKYVHHSSSSASSLLVNDLRDQHPRCLSLSSIHHHTVASVVSKLSAHRPQDSTV
eukprot:scaffold467_cov403-Prasinococcus_capsulatus_cf.AAC.13